MKSTTDYSIFKIHPHYKTIHESHVVAIMKSISDNNFLHLRPIHVNEEMVIEDGIHRFEAAKRLGLAIYYVILKPFTKEELIELMPTYPQRRWTKKEINDFKKRLLAQPVPSAPLAD